jgi:hypothetical protein
MIVYNNFIFISYTFKINFPIIIPPGFITKKTFFQKTIYLHITSLLSIKNEIVFCKR